jgi:hypothetical protein
MIEDEIEKLEFEEKCLLFAGNIEEAKKKAQEIDQAIIDLLMRKDL